MKTRILLTLVCLCLYGVLPLFAVPAIPWPVEKQQPDGTAITVYLKGDEKINWMQSADGYTLLYDNDKQVVYAQLDEDGHLVPSEILYLPTHLRSSSQENAIAGLEKGLFFSPEQVRMKQEIWKVEDSMLRSSTQSTSLIGAKKGLVILAEFTNISFTKSVDQFHNLMNQEGYSLEGARGSVRDYYKEASYGQLDFTVTVVGPYKVSNTAKYYRDNENRYRTFALEVVLAADADVDFKEYANENSVLESFHIIFAGYGDEAVNDGQQIWSHAWEIYPSITKDGVSISTYSCSPELRGSSGTNITHIGVVCHELCHAFGAPDFYDADGTDSGGDFEGTGYWDLMASGSWNGYWRTNWSFESGAIPAHINMYQKIQFGWVDPIILSDSYVGVKDMPNSAENPVAYKIETGIAQEYYVLENRQQVGYDEDVPGAGLLIYHVNVSAEDIYYNEVNNGHPQKMYPVCANRSSQYPTGTVTSYGSINEAGCVFNSDRSSFTDITTPAAFLWNGNGSNRLPLGKPITNISVSNGLVSFSYMAPPIVISHTLDSATLTLNWVAQDASKGIAGYGVYKNGERQQTTSNTYYRTQVTLGQVYTFGISAIYTDGTESSIVTIDVDTTPSSIDEVAGAETSVYPNPVPRASGFTVELGAVDTPVLLTVYDLTGRLIHQEEANSSKHKIDANFPSGTYLLQINRGEKRETLKLIIQ